MPRANRETISDTTIPSMPWAYNCRGCGITVIGSRWCSNCEPSENPGGHRSAWRDRATQARFRRDVLKAYDGRCAAMMSNGKRCPETTDLQAHHMVRGSDDPMTGVPLCRAHHRAVDPYAT